jgi:hypothetical protein
MFNLAVTINQDHGQHCAPSSKPYVQLQAGLIFDVVVTVYGMYHALQPVT